MGIAEIEGVVYAVLNLNTFCCVESKHIVEPVLYAETVVVTCNGNDCECSVHCAEGFVVPVPLFVCAVVCEVTAVGNEIGCGELCEGCCKCCCTLLEVFEVACLNVGNVDEADLVVAVIGCEGAPLAPCCAVTDTVAVCCTLCKTCYNELVHPVAVPLFAGNVLYGVSVCRKTFELKFGVCLCCCVPAEASVGCRVTVNGNGKSEGGCAVCFLSRSKAYRAGCSNANAHHEAEKSFDVFHFGFSFMLILIFYFFEIDGVACAAVSRMLAQIEACVHKQCTGMDFIRFIVNIVLVGVKTLETDIEGCVHQA